MRISRIVIGAMAAGLMGLAVTAAPGSAQSILSSPTECTVKLEEKLPLWSWTEAEKWAWNERICLGREANMSSRPGVTTVNCDTASGNPWNPNQVLRAFFLEMILQNPAFTKAVPEGRIAISCGVVDGSVFITGGRMAGSLSLHQTRFLGGFRADGFTVDNDLILNRSRFEEVAALDRIQVGGNLFIIGASVNDLGLRDARIAGDLRLDGSQFRDVIFANELEVQGDVILWKATLDQGLTISDGAVGGVFDASEATFKEALSARKTVFGGDVRLGHRSTLETVSFSRARIAGDLLLTGGAFKDTLRANKAVVGGSVIFGENSSYSEIDMEDIQIGENVEGAFTTFGNDLILGGSRVSGSIFLDEAVLGGGVYLNRAFVGRDLEFSASEVRGWLDAQNAIIHGYMSLGYKGSFQYVNLKNARIGETLEANGSTFKARFNAEGVHVGEDAQLNNKSEFTEVNLNDAVIGGRLIASESTFQDRLEAQRASVDRSVLLDRGGTFETVDFLNARLDRDVQLQGSTFNGPVNFSGAEINGTLVLGRDTATLTWGEQALLSLTDTRAKGINDNPASWDGLKGKLDVVGFTYDRYNAVGDWNRKAAEEGEAAWLLTWLEKQKGHNDVHYAQPYLQLAGVLQEHGWQSVANDIMIAKKTHQRDLETTPTWTRFILWFEWVTMGYGYHSWLALIWLFGFVGFGATILRYGSGHRAWKPLSERFYYSFDKIVPLIGFDDNHKTDDSRGWVRAYFYVHPILGYVFVSLFIASLTGLAR